MASSSNGPKEWIRVNKVRVVRRSDISSIVAKKTDSPDIIGNVVMKTKDNDGYNTYRIEKDVWPTMAEFEEELGV